MKGYIILLRPNQEKWWRKKVLPLTSKPTVRIYFESKTRNLRLPELLNYWKKPIFKILTDFISLTFQCFVSNSYFFDRNYYYTYSVYGPNEEVEFDRIHSVYYSQYQIFYTSQRSINFRTPYMKLLRLEDKFSYYPIQWNVTSYVKFYLFNATLKYRHYFRC